MGLMKQDLVCPGCQGRRFFDVEAHQKDPQYSNGTVRVSCAAEVVKDGSSFLGIKGQALVVADCTVFVCSGCGYSEYYTDVGKLQNMVDAGAKSVRVIDATPGSAGGYR